MFFRLLFLLTVIPFVELMILLALADHHGWVLTIALILVTGFIGALLTRWQGAGVLRKIRAELAAGQPPTDSLVEGMLILFAGALLLTPGVLTDAFGFLLLWPRFRKVLLTTTKALLLRHVKVVSQSGPVFRDFQTSPQPPFEPEPLRRYDDQGREIIDVEFTRKNSSS